MKTATLIVIGIVLSSADARASQQPRRRGCRERASHHRDRAAESPRHGGRSRHSASVQPARAARWRHAGQRAQLGQAARDSQRRARSEAADRRAGRAHRLSCRPARPRRASEVFREPADLFHVPQAGRGSRRVFNRPRARPIRGRGTRRTCRICGSGTRRVDPAARACCSRPTARSTSRPAAPPAARSRRTSTTSTARCFAFETTAACRRTIRLSASQGIGQRCSRSGIAITTASRFIRLRTPSTTPSSVRSAATRST